MHQFKVTLFRQMSRLVVTEIITQPCMTTRVQCIEKWAAVADICKCLHNFNGVLQVLSVICDTCLYPQAFRLQLQGFQIF
jgi:predicted ferric reductase